MSKFHRLGATRNFPRGKISADDEGGLRFAVRPWRGEVRIDFGTEVSWLAMPPGAARQLATVLLKVADEAEAKKPGN